MTNQKQQLVDIALNPATVFGDAYVKPQVTHLRVETENNLLVGSTEVTITPNPEEVWTGADIEAEFEWD